MHSLKTQLRKIFHVLNRISTSRVNEHGAEHNSAVITRHLSPAMRVASNYNYAKIPAAQLLLRVGDYDDYECKLMRRDNLGLFIFLILILPVLVSLMGELISEMGLGLWFPMVWTSFTLANSVLYGYSEVLFYVLYSLLFVII